LEIGTGFAQLLGQKPSRKRVMKLQQAPADGRPDFEQIQASVGDLLVDRPRRNILGRGQTGAGV